MDQYTTSGEKNVEFRYYCKYVNNSAHNDKYSVAFVNDEPVANNKGEYLSRIYKKNGKHRYYVTEEKEIIFCQGCGENGCTSWGCSGGFDREYCYVSKYVGQDLHNALKELFC